MLATTEDDFSQIGAIWPARVRALIETTKQIARELRPFVGNRLRETPTTVQSPADDLLEIAMRRGGVEQAPIARGRRFAVAQDARMDDPGLAITRKPGTAVERNLAKKV